LTPSGQAFEATQNEKRLAEANLRREEQLQREAHMKAKADRFQKRSHKTAAKERDEEAAERAVNGGQRSFMMDEERNVWTHAIGKADIQEKRDSSRGRSRSRSGSTAPLPGGLAGAASSSVSKGGGGGLRMKTAEDVEGVPARPSLGGDVRAHSEVWTPNITAERADAQRAQRRRSVSRDPEPFLGKSAPPLQQPQPSGAAKAAALVKARRDAKSTATARPATAGAVQRGSNGGRADVEGLDPKALSIWVAPVLGDDIASCFKREKVTGSTVCEWRQKGLLDNYDRFKGKYPRLYLSKGDLKKLMRALDAPR